MASVVENQQQPHILADRPEEHALLKHGRDRGGVIFLLGGEYAVDGDRLLLPEGCASGHAARVCEAFAEAAQAHQRAQDQRRTFRLV